MPDQVTYNWTDSCDVTSSGCVQGPFNNTNGASTQVVQYNPTITTQLSSTSIAVGQSAHDTSKIMYDTTPPKVSGTVHYTVYNNPNCTGSGTDLTPASNGYTGGTVPDSAPFVPTTAGTFYFVATFSGDAADAVAGPVTSGCSSEPLTVTPASPGLTTTASAGGTVPTTLSDTAHLSGGVNPSGTITFHLYSNSSCTSEVAGSPVTMAVSGNGDYVSPSISVTNAGTYYWEDSYSGDSNNNAIPLTGCGATNESATVNPVSPSLSTTASAGGTAPVSLSDTANLSGGLSPTGTITFHLYSNSSCTSEVSGSPVTKTVSGNGSYTSPAISVSSAGTYFWRDSYSGDSNNSAIAVTACGATNESAIVTSPPSPPSGGSRTPAISITKNPKGQTISSGGTANFTIVVTNTGTLTLSNVTVSDPLSPNCNQTSSSIPALASMAPGASVTYNCSLGNVTASFTNVATATGTGSNGQTVTANDSAPVTVTPPLTPPPAAVVTHPAISIVKDPKSQSFASGGTANFTITVKNTGDVTLSDVTVTDPLSPDCDRSLGTLNVGASKSYSCSRTGVKAAFTNIATATGKPPTGSSVKASDHAAVTITAPFVPPAPPKIAIVKSPKSQTVTTRISNKRTTTGVTKTTVKYGTAHFGIKVTNTGKVALNSVKVSDPLSPNCNHSIGSLAVGASKSYSCDKPTVTRAFTNVATATGISPKGVKVTATDHANVLVKTKTTSTSGAKFTG